MCPYCSKVLSRSDGLHRHIREVHEKKPVDMWDPCPLCYKRFKSTRHLTSHVKQVHGVNLKDLVGHTSSQGEELEGSYTDQTLFYEDSVEGSE